MRKTIIEVPWFDLGRHEEPAPVEPAVEPEPTPVDPEPVADPEPDTGEDWEAKAKKAEAEAAKWKAMARKHEGTAKANSDAAKKLAEIEEGQKTEQEKLVAAKERAEQKLAAANERAVLAEVRALAADFADPTDAIDAVRAADFIDGNGEIDLDGIRNRLGDLLEAKPHWRKPAVPAAPAAPKPDPGQGARKPAGPTDFRTVSREEFLAEAAKVGFRPRQ